MKRIVTITLMLMLVLTMTSCTALGLGKNKEKTDAVSSSQSDSSSSQQTDSSADGQMDAPDKSEEEQKEEKTIQGIINKIGNYLVLLTEDGEYHVMDFGEGLDTEPFKEGDKVEITYTGDLADEENSPVIVAMEKMK